MRVLIGICAISVVIPSASIRAQQPVTPGDRVRVSNCYPRFLRGKLRNRCDRHVGTLTALTAQAVTLRVEDMATAVPLDSVTRLEVSRGRKSHLLEGIGIGFLAGAGLGALVGAAVDCTQLLGTTSNQASCTGLGAAAGAASGLLIGAAVGALNKTDRWEEVPLDRLRVSVGPQRDGRFALAMSFSF
jgi:hypothetical protein